jgi:hypothetical protein
MANPTLKRGRPEAACPLVHVEAVEKLKMKKM